MGLTSTTAMKVRLSDLIFHNRYWMYLVRTCSNEPRFLLVPRNRNMRFTPLTCVEEHAWNFRLEVVQASFLMDNLFTDDCFIKNAHSSILALGILMDELGAQSSILALDDSYAQAWSWLIS